MTEGQSAGTTRRARRVALVTLRIAGCALLLLALYRTVALVLPAPDRWMAGRPLFPNEDRNYAAIRPALVGALLVALAAWTARLAFPSRPAEGAGRYRAAAAIRSAAIAAFVAAAWTMGGDLRDGWRHWEYARAGGSPTTPAQYRAAPRDPVGSAAAALSRLAPTVPLLALGATLLAVQRPLVRLLTPRLGGCPGCGGCGYEVDESKQERCPECGLALAKGAPGD